MNRDSQTPEWVLLPPSCTLPFNRDQFQGKISPTKFDSLKEKFYEFQKDFKVYLGERKTTSSERTGIEKTFPLSNLILQ